MPASVKRRFRLSAYCQEIEGCVTRIAGCFLLLITPRRRKRLAQKTVPVLSPHSRAVGDLPHLDLKTDGHRSGRLRKTGHADQIGPRLSKLADILQSYVAANFNRDRV